MKRRTIACIVVLCSAAFTFAADRAEVEAVFRQGENHYAGCKLIDRWNSVIRRGRGSPNRHRLVFEGIKLVGKDVKIASAELRMKFVEESWSRIPNAELEIYDAAEKDGKPLAVRQYRKHKVV